MAHHFSEIIGIIVGKVVCFVVKLSVVVLLVLETLMCLKNGLIFVAVSVFGGNFMHYFER